jgi:serine/threonine protein kinase
MSYELNNNLEWDAYSNDLFSLGVILYTLTVGKPPFKESCSKDIWFNVISSGKWLTPAIINQQAAKVYSDLNKSLLELLDSILKPENQRINIQQILQSNWLNQEF